MARTVGGAGGTVGDAGGTVRVRAAGGTQSLARIALLAARVTPAADICRRPLQRLHRVGRRSREPQTADLAGLLHVITCKSVFTVHL